SIPIPSPGCTAGTRLSGSARRPPTTVTVTSRWTPGGRARCTGGGWRRAPPPGGGPPAGPGAPARPCAPPSPPPRAGRRPPPGRGGVRAARCRAGGPMTGRAAPSAARWELLRALGAVAGDPADARATCGALGLLGPGNAEHTEVFVLNCPPYASVYLGAEGGLG